LLSWITVAFRLFVRFWVIRAPGWDDLFVVLSLLTMSVGLGSICISTDKGLGQHLLLLDLDQASAFLHSFYVFNGSYAMSTALIKISLLLQYIRLYHRGTLLYNICRALVVFVALWGVAYSIIAWVPCVPVSDYWTVIYEQDISGLRCYGYGSQYVAAFTATYESHAAVNMVLDLVVMALPIPLYFEPGARGRTRMGLVGVIVMGTIVNVFSVWRFAATIEHKAGTYPTFDPTWYGPIMIVMAGLETASACICASIPIFWGPMVASASHVLGHIFVTKEVHVTTEHRFGDLGSNDTLGQLEMQGTGTSMKANTAHHARAGSRLEWVGKDGVQQHCETWTR
ncbi:integral membrane protein, partial [Chaetomidium leptoderma]